MYELRLAAPSFYRVKEGQTAESISGTFGCPVRADLVSGDIIALRRGAYVQYAARVGDTFESIAAKFGTTAAELEAINGGVVYPTRRLFVPR